MWLLWGCLLVILSIAQSNDDHDPLTIVKTNLGLVHGRRVVTERNTTAYVFLGVPYAEPPIGPLRYRLPMQKKPWTDTIDAQQYKVREV
jgi:carboxylesterase type B